MGYTLNLCMALFEGILKKYNVNKLTYFICFVYWFVIAVPKAC